MCAICGCSHDHHHHTGDDHDHGHDHGHRTVTLGEAVLAKNDRLAERNRGWLAGREILALNLMSSPGAWRRSSRRSARWS